VPMQFFILFVGAMVFVFYQFVAPPLFFNSVESGRIAGTAEYARLEAAHRDNFVAKRAAIDQMLHDPSKVERVRELQREEDATRKAAADLVRKRHPGADISDANYVFLTFVTQFLPAGLVGLVLAAIFCAAMSSTAAGLNSLASTTVVDVVRRLVWRDASEHDYVLTSKWLTVFWGLFGIVVAEFAGRLGSLIEAVNKLGSLFYGTILGIFLPAFYTKEVSGTAASLGAIIGEAAVLWCAAFTNLAWLWWNVIGCVVGVAAALAIEKMLPARQPAPATETLP